MSEMCPVPDLASDYLIDFGPYANTPLTKPSDFAHDALGVSDDAALQELSGQRRSRDKDWPSRA